MALRLKPEMREAWRLKAELAHLRERSDKQELERWMAALGRNSEWRPVPRAEPIFEPEPPEHTDMFIKGYVD